MAGLVKKRNSYIAVWYSNGKPVFKSTRVHITPTAADGTLNARQLKKLAMQVAETMERAAKGSTTAARALEAVRAAAGSPPCPTLSEYAAQWLRWRNAQPGAERSLNNRSNSIRSLERLSPELWALRLDAITPAHAADYVTAALDEVSGSTVERRLADITAMLNRAVAEGVITRNPFTGARVPRWERAGQGDRRREPFTPEDVALMLREFPGEWPDMLRVCLLLGGQRLGDVAGLQWSAIDWAQGLVRVTAQKTNRPTRKPLLPQLRALLEKRRQALGSQPGDYVFPYAAWKVAAAGGKTSKLSLEFSDLCRAAGIARKIPSTARGSKVHALTDKTSHSLRTTAVTVLLCAGVPAELVQWLVGHDDKLIEREHYFKPNDAAQIAALQPLVQLLTI
jgi:integrase